MIIYFKSNRDNKLVVLFCSHIELHTDDPKAELNQCGIPFDEFRLPVNIRPRLSISRNKKKSLLLEDRCVNCLRFVSKEEIVSLKYRYIIKKYQHERKHLSKLNQANMVLTVEKDGKNIILDEPAFVRNDISFIPHLLRQLYPKMKYQEYLDNIKSHQFLDKIMPVCSDCYVSYIPFFGNLGGVTKKDDNQVEGLMFKYQTDTKTSLKIKNRIGQRTSSAPSKPVQILALNEKWTEHSEEAISSNTDLKYSTFSKPPLFNNPMGITPNSDHHLNKRINSSDCFKLRPKTIQGSSTDKPLFIKSNYGSTINRNRLEQSVQSISNPMATLNLQSLPPALDASSYSSEAISKRHKRDQHGIRVMLPPTFSKYPDKLKRKYIERVICTTQETEPVDSTCYETTRGKPSADLDRSRSKSTRQSSKTRRLRLFFKK